MTALTRMDYRAELEKRKGAGDTWMVAMYIYDALPREHPLRKLAYLLYHETYGCTYNDVLGFIECAELEGVLEVKE